MRVQVNISSDNAAFSGAAGRPEVARLLRQTADRIEAGEDIGRLMDYNGNGVGRFDCEEPQTAQCEAEDWNTGQCVHEAGQSGECLDDTGELVSGNQREAQA